MVIGWLIFVIFIIACFLIFSIGMLYESCNRDERIVLFSAVSIILAIIIILLGIYVISLV